jgi:hypothetical protein
MKLPQQIPLNFGNRFCEMELEHTKRFLGLSRHFVAMSTVALLVAIAGLHGVTTQKTQAKLFINNNNNIIIVKPSKYT